MYISLIAGSVEDNFGVLSFEIIWGKLRFLQIYSEKSKSILTICLDNNIYSLIILYQNPHAIIVKK